VILTGILGSMFGTTVLDRIGVHDASAQGFALGLASHGIGTARALQVNETAGAFSALAMGLNGLATSLLAPLIMHLLRQWLWP
jgi:putative effector of murein hydrolase